MRKDYKIGKIIKGNLYSTYIVEGLNLDRFLQRLNREDIEVLNAIKKGNKSIILTVKNCYVKKFFAITNELCYNTKRVKYQGLFLPLYLVYKNLGWLLGIILFVSCVFWFGGKIFSIDYSGNGSIYSSQVESFLEEKGVSVWKDFSSLDLKKLSNEIFASTNKFSFVNCKRNGNILHIELIAKTEEIDRIDKGKKQLYSTVDGKVEKITVLRGNAKVNEGDFVQEGTLLVDSQKEVGDKVVDVGLIAEVSILYQRQFVYRSEGENEVEIAEILAEQILGESVEISTEKFTEGKEFVYTVTLTFRQIITS